MDFNKGNILNIIEKVPICFVILEHIATENKVDDFVIRYASKEKIGSVYYEEILNKSYHQLIPDLSHEIFLCFYKAVYEGKEAKFGFCDKNNKEEFAVSCYPIDKNFCCLILEEVKSEDVFKENTDIDLDAYRMTIENLVDAVFIYDIKNKSINFTKKNSNLDCLKNSLHNVPSAFIEEEFIYQDDINEFLRVFDEILQGNKKSSCNMRLKLENGEYIWASFALNTYYKDKKNKAIGVIKYIAEEGRKKTLELKMKAERDSLTRLYNKGETEKRITEFLVEPKESFEIEHSVMMIVDIDNFKTLNDSVGHIFGDKVLAEVAAKLKTVFKATDIIGRIGGDEFMVFIKEAISDDFIVKKAEEVCSLIKRTYNYSKGYVNISCSIGIAMYPKHGKTFEELYKNADTGLYKVKKLGKDGFYVYNFEND